MQIGTVKHKEADHGKIWVSFEAQHNVACSGTVPQSMGQGIKAKKSAEAGRVR